MSTRMPHFGSGNLAAVVSIQLHVLHHRQVIDLVMFVSVALIKNLSELQQ